MLHRNPSQTATPHPPAAFAVICSESAETFLP
jgi:hypothetical protein